MPQFSLSSIFSKQGKINPNTLTGNFDFSKTEGIFNNKPVAAPLYFLDNAKNKYVLGENNEEKRIEVDLTRQRLYVYQGEDKIYDFAISSGKINKTPVGNFQIWIKLRYTNMKGGSKLFGTYYDLPNVAYAMFFYNDKIPKSKGYGIHAAYWHNNFGQPMSLGSIDMKTEDAERLYYWTKQGTDVIIYGMTPT